MRGAARHIRERCAETEQAAQVLAVYTESRAGGAVCCSVVSAAVAVDVDRRVCLRDLDGGIAGGYCVVVVACEGPVRGAAGNVRERCAEVEEAGEVLGVHALCRAGGAMRLAV